MLEVNINMIYNDKQIESGGDALSKNRVIWLDFARALAILSVVIMHCTEHVFNMDFDALGNMRIAFQLFRDACFILGRLGVPAFLMISGCLLLPRDYTDSKKVLSFYKKNLLPLLITSEVWIVIYGIRHFVRGTEGYGILALLEEMFFLKTNEMSHMWYIPMIIGMYFIIPFLSNAVRNIKGKALWIPVSIVLVATFAFNFLKALNEAFGWGISFNTVVDMTFLGGTYGVYLIMGLMIQRGDFKKIRTPILLAVSLISFALTVYTSFGLRSIDYSYRLWYDVPGIWITSVCTVELISRVDFSHGFLNRLSSAAASVSALSFGMYFIHLPLIIDFGPVLDNIGLPEPVMVMIYTVIVFILSYLIAFVISKIPVVKRLMLNIKSK